MVLPKFGRHCQDNGDVSNGMSHVLSFDDVVGKKRTVVTRYWVPASSPRVLTDRKRRMQEKGRENVTNEDVLCRMDEERSIVTTHNRKANWRDCLLHDFIKGKLEGTPGHARRRI